MKIAVLVTTHSNEEKMRRYARIVFGVFILVFSSTLFAREGASIFLAIFMALLGLFILRQEVMGLLWLLWQALRSFGKLLGNRIEKVERERYCGITTERGGCAGNGVFAIIATTRDMKKPMDFHAGRGILCCVKHHPYSDEQGRGSLKHETEKMLAEKNLAVERIHMVERPYG